jgi:integrase
MLDHCRGLPDLEWLAHVILALAMTGLRISELASLRWSDLDLKGGMVRLADKTTSARRRSRSQARTLKSGRGRFLPIQEELLAALGVLPRHPDGSVFHGQRGATEAGRGPSRADSRGPEDDGRALPQAGR